MVIPIPFFETILDDQNRGTESMPDSAPKSLPLLLVEISVSLAIVLHPEIPPQRQVTGYKISNPEAGCKGGQKNEEPLTTDLCISLSAALPFK